MWETCISGPVSDIRGHGRNLPGSCILWPVRHLWYGHGWAATIFFPRRLSWDNSGSLLSSMKNIYIFPKKCENCWYFCMCVKTHLSLWFLHHLFTGIVSNKICLKRGKCAGCRIRGSSGWDLCQFTKMGRGPGETAQLLQGLHLVLILILSIPMTFCKNAEVGMTLCIYVYAYTCTYTHTHTFWSFLERSFI